MMKNNYIKQKRKDQNPVNHWKIFEGQLVFLLAMVILFVVAYTFILQQAYTKTALKTEIERDISSADAVHKLVNDRLGRKDFNEIKSKMCIRDSGPRCCKRDAMIAFKNGIDYVNAHYGVTLQYEQMPVSYTHLDVYKRQGVWL